MLIERHPELVGITIHHIDRGIDHGDIIITSRPDMSPDDNFEIIDGKTFKLGNECMVAAVRQLHDGKAERVLRAAAVKRPAKLLDLKLEMGDQHFRAGV